MQVKNMCKDKKMVPPTYPDEKLDLVYNCLFRNLLQARLKELDEVFSLPTSTFNMIFSVGKHEFGVSGPNMIPLGLIMAIIMIEATRVVIRMLTVMKLIMDVDVFPRPNGLFYDKKADRFYEEKNGKIY